MQVRDFRNDVILAEACRTDVELHCPNVPVGAQLPSGLAGNSQLHCYVQCKVRPSFMAQFTYPLACVYPFWMHTLGGVWRNLYQPARVLLSTPITRYVTRLCVFNMPHGFEGSSGPLFHVLK